jgi:hypothetical protein
MYVFGSDKAKKRFRLLKLNRLARNPQKLADVLQQDPQEYTEAQVNSILEVRVLFVNAVHLIRLRAQ